MDDDLDTPTARATIAKLASVVARDNAPGDRAGLRNLLQILGFRLD
jgi:hypothetical protein